MHALQIVRALSVADVPQKVVDESNIEDLIAAMLVDKETVADSNSRLERLRQEKKEGNLITNWWGELDEKVQEAHLDLNRAIGRLTQKSSQLLVVNTAMSRVLSDQQVILLKQQEVLLQQARELKQQDEKILEQQTQLAEQQRQLNAANQGLMEAKGVTQEQAIKLVGCVTRVTEAESKIDAANEALRSALGNEMECVVAQCDERVRGAVVELRSAQQDFERRQDEVTQTWSTRVRGALAELAINSEAFRSDVTTQLRTHMQATTTALAAQDAATVQTAWVANQVQTKQKALESTVASLQARQAKTARQNRIAFAFVVCVAVLSLGWQVAHLLFAA